MVKLQTQDIGETGLKLPVANPARQDENVGFLSADELLKRLPISRGTLTNWMKAGKIPYVKAARRVLFHWPSVEQAMLRMQRGG